MSKKIVIVGGHGRVPQHLTRLLAPNHQITSIIRRPGQQATIRALGAEPLVLSLEDASVADFTSVFEGKDVVYFSAGAGEEASDERTKKVDFEGAVKVFDAVEGVRGPKPRVILVSAVDVRGDQTNYPAHYNEADIAFSKQVWSQIGVYMHWKHEADKNLVKRSAFRWTILRPGLLSDGPRTDKAVFGRTHITGSISRVNVAVALMHLLDREEANGLAIDMVGGEQDMAESLDAAIKRGVSDYMD